MSFVLPNSTSNTIAIPALPWPSSCRAFAFTRGRIPRHFGGDPAHPSQPGCPSLIHAAKPIWVLCIVQKLLHLTLDATWLTITHLCSLEDNRVSRNSHFQDKSPRKGKGSEIFSNDKG